VEVEADVRQGTRRDAVLYSAGANATHGLRRTNEDKRRAVTVLLEDEEWRGWSDREIARKAGVSNRFVGNVRDEVTVRLLQSNPLLSSSDHQPTVNRSQSTARTGADGRTINTANIGKPKAETAAPAADLSEYTQPRHLKTYSPPPLPDPEPDALGEDTFLDALVSDEAETTDLEPYRPPYVKPTPAPTPEIIPPRKMDLVTGEGIIRPDAPPELIEAANQPVPLETPDTRMKAALKREGYDDAEKVGKHLAALLHYEEGRLMEIIGSPSGRLLGLPKFHKLLLKELGQGERTVTI
jgi:hypothetical protein